jgi:hypothetical protein
MKNTRGKKQSLSTNLRDFKGTAFKKKSLGGLYTCLGKTVYKLNYLEIV